MPSGNALALGSSTPSLVRPTDQQSSERTNTQQCKYYTNLVCSIACEQAGAKSVKELFALRPRSARSLAVSVPGLITHCVQCRCKAVVVEDGNAQAAPLKVANRFLKLDSHRSASAEAENSEITPNASALRVSPIFMNCEATHTHEV